MKHHKTTYDKIQENVDATDKRNAEARKAAREAKHDHKYEPGAYGVCRRCGEEKH